MKAIITVVGKDRIGIIAGVSNMLAEYDVNILDINQTILQDYFTMMMLVDLSKLNIARSELTEKLNKKSKELGVSIIMQNEEIFREMHRI
jgi:ACT domain-containing protein